MPPRIDVARMPYWLPYSQAGAESMLESTAFFPAIFFGAIIGVIVFVALSQLLLDPHQ